MSDDKLYMVRKIFRARDANHALRTEGKHKIHDVQVLEEQHARGSTDAVGFLVEKEDD